MPVRILLEEAMRWLGETVITHSIDSWSRRRNEPDAEISPIEPVDYDAGADFSEWRNPQVIMTDVWPDDLPEEEALRRHEALRKK